ncbi:MAG TPA: hypothetical protein VNN77_10270 [candidate division Zixibacteria bacterium]|nr:hypothetical protein [candidate division Zixibacteria bacterium]
MRRKRRRSFDLDKVMEARAALWAAAATVRPYGSGRTADREACRRALQAMLDAGVGKQASDRIAVEMWGIPVTAWVSVRGVSRKFLGCRWNSAFIGIPQEFMPRWRPKGLAPVTSRGDGTCSADNR